VQLAVCLPHAALAAEAVTRSRAIFRLTEPSDVNSRKSGKLHSLQRGSTSNIVENFASGIVESDSRSRPETCWLSSHLGVTGLEHNAARLSATASAPLPANGMHSSIWGSDSGTSHTDHDDNNNYLPEEEPSYTSYKEGAKAGMAFIKCSQKAEPRS
jgi:hypothetical protein